MYNLLNWCTVHTTSVCSFKSVQRMTHRQKNIIKISLQKLFFILLVWSGSLRVICKKIKFLKCSNGWNQIGENTKKIGGGGLNSMKLIFISLLRHSWVPTDWSFGKNLWNLPFLQWYNLHSKVSRHYTNQHYNIHNSLFCVTQHFNYFRKFFICLLYCHIFWVTHL